MRFWEFLWSLFQYCIAHYDSKWRNFKLECHCQYFSIRLKLSPLEALDPPWTLVFSLGPSSHLHLCPEWPLLGSGPMSWMTIIEVRTWVLSGHYWSQDLGPEWLLLKSGPGSWLTIIAVRTLVLKDHYCSQDLGLEHNIEFRTRVLKFIIGVRTRVLKFIIGVRTRVLTAKMTADLPLLQPHCKMKADI